MASGLNGVNSGLAQYNGLMNYIDMADSLSTNTDFSGAMSMNGSIYGNSYGGSGYAYGGNSMLQDLYNTDPIAAVKYQVQMGEEQKKAQMESDGRLKITAAKEKFKETAAENAVKKEMSTLQTLIKNNEQDKIKGQYDRYLKAVGEKLRKEGALEDKVNPDGTIDEKASAQEIEAQAEFLYATETGERLIDDIDKHGDSEFIHGLKQGTGIGFFLDQQKNAKDNIADITNQTVSVGDRASQVLGAVVGAGLTILGVVGLVKHGGNPFKAIGNLSKSLNLSSAERAISKAKTLNSGNGSIATMEIELSKVRDTFNEIKAQDKLKKATKKLSKVK